VAASQHSGLIRSQPLAIVASHCLLPLPRSLPGGRCTPGAGAERSRAISSRPNRPGNRARVEGGSSNHAGDWLR
jgi:hypothetical protein